MDRDLHFHFFFTLIYFSLHCLDIFFFFKNAFTYVPISRLPPTFILLVDLSSSLDNKSGKQKSSKLKSASSSSQSESTEGNSVQTGSSGVRVCVCVVYVREVCV